MKNKRLSCVLFHVLEVLLKKLQDTETVSFISCRFIPSAFTPADIILYKS